jgi:hypothetical protein
VEAAVSGGLKAQEAAFTRSMEGLMKVGRKGGREGEREEQPPARDCDR